MIFTHTFHMMLIYTLIHHSHWSIIDLSLPEAMALWLWKLPSGLCVVGALVGSISRSTMLMDQQKVLCGSRNVKKKHVFDFVFFVGNHEVCCCYFFFWIIRFGVYTLDDGMESHHVKTFQGICISREAVVPDQSRWSNRCFTPQYTWRIIPLSKCLTMLISKLQ